jgi:hypothetical protein
MLLQGSFLPPFGVSRTLQNGMHASCLFIRLSIPNCPRSGSTKTSAGARTDWNAMPSPSCRPRAQAAPSTFVSRGNVSARQPGCCTRSSRALLGSLLRQRESDARRISLRYPLLVPSSAGLDVDTPSLSWTIMGESFPLFISSHPASRSCHLSIQALRCSRSCAPPSISASSRRASVIYGG